MAETYSTKEDKKDLSLITYIEVEPAHESDANAVVPYLESTAEHEMAPKQVLADTLYGSDENCEKAKDLGIERRGPGYGHSLKRQVQPGRFHLSR